MDSSRFDAWTRIFARPASRRRALGALAAVALAPARATAKPHHAACLGAGKQCLAPPASEAQGIGQGKRAGQGQDHAKGKRQAAGKGNGKGKHHGHGGKQPPSCDRCCSGTTTTGPDGTLRCACKNEGEPCAKAAECCGKRCANGACAGCKNDQVYCAGACIDVQSNDNHCGDCDTACAAGQRCVNGACVCDATSCPKGCCGGAACRPGTDDQACGAGGHACVACQAPATCGGGPSSRTCGCVKTTCAAQGKYCGAIPDGCGGSLDCGTCRSPETCGGGDPGQANVCGCTPDPVATTCDGKCGTVTNNCGQAVDCTAHCAGCCDGTTCNAGTSDAACGKNGAGCVSCSSPQSCRDQTCCAPDPDATTCQGKCGTVQNNCGQDVDCTALCGGCCQGGTCVANTSDAACGANGGVCLACSSCYGCSGGTCVPHDGICCNGGNGVCQSGGCLPCGAGRRCDNGQCVCDATSCPGGCCRQDGTCQPGTAQDACGENGGSCNACPSGTVCYYGSCCTPVPDQQACGSICGTTTNNCGQTVDCTAACGGCCDANGICHYQTSNDACGKNGATCVACPAGTVCYQQSCCTPQCDGKKCGDNNQCGGICTACPDCQTCVGGACQVAIDGTPCGGANSGVRCCNGRCPTSPSCLAAGTCCGQGTTCAECCSGQSFENTDACHTTGYVCDQAATGFGCGRDADCSQLDGASICQCGTCCKTSGQFCTSGGQCCSKTCQSNQCA